MSKLMNFATVLISRYGWHRHVASNCKICAKKALAVTLETCIIWFTQLKKEGLGIDTVKVM
jgi:hypothetical protein